MSENPAGDPTPGAGSPPPSYGSPSAPDYGQPAAPQYGAPQQPYAPPPQYGQPQGFGGTGAVSDSDRRTWAMLAHLSGILLWFVGPLIVWLMYKDRDEFLKDQSLEALNFQISVTIAGVASFVLAVVSFGILSFLPFVVGVVNLVFCIIAGIAANRGERYRYPVTLRLMK